ncbi:hypothetical protein HMPREF3232_00112 [Fannyhessea vaginae]|nr:hypothetical protein HMPREF3232_00112 [Fannyhessea vaginae]
MTAKSRSIDNRERAGNRKDILWPIQLIHKQLQAPSKTPNNKGSKKAWSQHKPVVYPKDKGGASSAKMISREDITNHNYFGIYCIHYLVLNRFFVYLMKWFYFVYISPKIKFFHV